MGGLPTNRTVNGFAVDFDNSKTMFVAMRDGLFRSLDAGGSWKSVGNELKNLAAVTVNPKNPKQIFAATSDGTIFISADAAMKWQKQQ